MKPFLLVLFFLLSIHPICMMASNRDCDWEAFLEVTCVNNLGCDEDGYQVIFSFTPFSPSDVFLIDHISNDTSLVELEDSFFIAGIYPLGMGYSFSIIDAEIKTCQQDFFDSVVTCETEALIYYDAADDFFCTTIDNPIIINILENDIGDVFLYNYLETSVERGSVEWLEDGNLLYTPLIGFTGYDYFLYQVNTEEGFLFSAIVEVLVLEAESGVSDEFVFKEILDCNSETGTFTLSLIFPVYSTSHYWRFCGEEIWIPLEENENEDQLNQLAPLVIDSLSVGYCIEIRDSLYPEEIEVLEEWSIPCLITECCEQPLQLMTEAECNKAEGILTGFATLLHTEESGDYEWKSCWTDTWNPVLFQAGFAIPVEVTIANGIGEMICLEFRNTACPNQYNAYWLDDQPSTYCTVIPIELLEFKGAAQSQHNEIYWSTASENDNQQFILECSADGQNFQTITTIPSQGNSNTIQEYIYKDFSFHKKENYYRLSTVDFNGMIEFYSSVISVGRTEKQHPVLHLYPNPVNESLQVSFKPVNTQQVFWQIWDIVGQMVLNGETEVGQSGQSLKIGVEHLAEGTYFLQVHTDSDSKSQAFQVIR